MGGSFSREGDRLGRELVIAFDVTKILPVEFDTEKNAYKDNRILQKNKQKDSYVEVHVSSF